MKRIPQLDLLRGVAVLLVLGRHWSGWPVPSLWTQVGWIGVDLFFVLSGFLIGGLLFKEYQTRGRIAVGRFLGRRALKLYPGLFVMLVAGLSIDWLAGTPPPSHAWREFVFVQNYLPGLWQHTWSLAVEEHFYLALPLVLSGSLIFRKGSPRPLSAWPAIAVGLMVACLAMRLLTPAYQWEARLFQTHLRLDSLAFGVLIAYFWHLHPERVQTLVRRGKPALVLLVVLGIAPALVRPCTSYWMSSLGLTGLYTGFGALLLLVLDRKPSLGPGGRGLAFIGVHSYGIYLWHMLCQKWSQPLLTTAGIGVPGAAAILYFCASVAVGVVMTRLVELPVLAWRDRRLPSRTDGTAEISATGKAGEAPYRRTQAGRWAGRARPPLS